MSKGIVPKYVSVSEYGVLNYYEVPKNFDPNKAGILRKYLPQNIEQAAKRVDSGLNGRTDHVIHVDEDEEYEIRMLKLANEFSNPKPKILDRVSKAITWISVSSDAHKIASQSEVKPTSKPPSILNKILEIFITALILVIIVAFLLFLF